MATTITIPTLGARARWLAVATVATALLVVAAAPSFTPRGSLAADTSTKPDHTISVSGTGRVILAPDTADIHLGVLVQRPTVKSARADAATAMTAVIAALKKLGIADADMQTSNITLQPLYDYSNTSVPRLKGYQFSNSLSVTVHDLDKVGDAIDDALAAGATSFDGVTFRVADETKAESQARSAAMADAKAKATALAAAAGVSIEGVASISETVAPIPYPVYYAGEAAGAAIDKSVPTPVQTGTNEVVVTVAVVYLIP